MKMDIKELETADYDILENLKTALYRVWKKRVIVLAMTLVGILLCGLYVSVIGIKTTYVSYASIYSAVYGSYETSSNGVTMMNKYANMLGSTIVCDRAAKELKKVGITSSDLKNMVLSGDIYLNGIGTDYSTYGTKLTLVVNMRSSDHIVDITNAMARAFADEINNLLGVSAIRVMDESSDYMGSQTVGTMTFFILFAAAAFVGTAGVIFVREFFSSKVYRISQCEPNKEFVLGMIPYNSKEGI